MRIVKTGGFTTAFLTLLLCNVFADESKVSFENDVQPILQANCYGCHQPAQKQGGFDATQFQSLLGSADSEQSIVVPGKPEESFLIEAVTTDESGKAYMPPDSKPISNENVQLIARWIKEGANNDSIAKSSAYSKEHPPVYSRPPVVSSLEYSPDGKLLAVSGFHEVLILDSEKHEIQKRLIGLSSRIESLSFSPDGKRLAVAGGIPGRLGEIQVWELDAEKLLLSKSVGYDCAGGINWSPDGKLLSFGLTDTTVRVIEATTGNQVLFQGAHDDWVRDTVFSVDGKRLVSVGRDTTCKLIEVETERFIDNLTSITPAILKGGISSVARHPARDEVVIGCADGIIKVYRMDRQTKRVIGDDANLIRKMPKLHGRVESVDVSVDGNRLVGASSLDGKGEVRVFTYEFNTSLTDELKAILRKLPQSWNKQEREKIEGYWQQDVKEIAMASFDEGIYSSSFHPNGTMVAVAGASGNVSIIDATNGSIVKKFMPFPIADSTSGIGIAQANWKLTPAIPASESSFVAKDKSVTAIAAYPDSIRIDSKLNYVQMVVRAKLEDGSWIDVTAQCKIESDNCLDINTSGLIQLADPNHALKTASIVNVSYGAHNIEVPVELNVQPSLQIDFVEHVNPLLTRVGCNTGTCHGSQAGKNGFKLSLRGYDSIYDLRSLTDELSARRIDLVTPEQSLLLAKPSAAVPHEGGKLLDKNHKYYNVIKEWIASGAKPSTNPRKVVSVAIQPENPVLAIQGDSQQMRVIAKYDDGTEKDVTHESFIESSDLEVATVANNRCKAIRRGETAILARYEGAFTATTVTVMGDRSEFVWKQPESYSKIDDLVAAKWLRMKITPSELCSDSEFVRRVHLDLTGLPPSTELVAEFIADERESVQKRNELVDSLIGNDDFIEYWTNKWADLLMVNRKYLGVEGSKKFRTWIRESVAGNIPYNEFVSKIITASGSNLDNPAASYFKILRTPEDTMENTTHLFLGTRFNCNKCHDHPFERWTQDQYYETAAFFSQVKLERDPRSGKKQIGGSAVESAKPMYEKISDDTEGSMKHERTGMIVDPKFPFDCDHTFDPDASRRQQFAAWLTSANNPYFSTSYVNRLWGYLMGRGLIEPLDDIRAGNPPTNPELLEYLTTQFVDHNFDMRHILAEICKSRTYQLSIQTNPLNENDFVNYSHAVPRRLPAEVLFDTVHHATGSLSSIPGFEPGTRAAMLSDSGAQLPSGILSTLGRPTRESACECERSNELELGSVLAMISGPDIARAISDPKNAIAKLAKESKDNRELINQIYMRVLNRQASDTEIDLALASFRQIESDHQQIESSKAQRHTWFETEKPKLEKARAAAIEETQTALNAAIEKHDPTLVAKEDRRRLAIESAKTAYNNYRKDDATLYAKWRDRQLTQLNWHPLQIALVEAESKRTFEILPDRSVLADHKKTAPDVYTITATTDLYGITGVRLELLADKRFPASGPGIAQNGNFVLNEIDFEIAPVDQPEQWRKIGFSSARSFFDQPGYPIQNIIDGKYENGVGWATMGSIGKVNWTCLATELPVGFVGGSKIRVKLHQKFDNQHQIGRFRISLTTHSGDIGLSGSEEFLASVSKPFAELNKQQKKSAISIIERDDKQLADLKQALADAKKPLAIDPEITNLRQKLARVSKPVPPDATLEQLKRDFEFSKTQLEDARLTAAQDLTWALINSPSFLFNR